MRRSPDGRRVSCWWCNGDLKKHPERDVTMKEWSDFMSDDWDPSLIDLLMCESCGATVMVTRSPETHTDHKAPYAPYDRNRCPFCGGYALWQSDFNYDEVYGEGDGIVSYLTCQRCGCDLEYSKRDDEDDYDDERCDDMLDEHPEGDVEPDGGPDSDSKGSGEE